MTSGRISDEHTKLDQSIPALSLKFGVVNYLKALLVLFGKKLLFGKEI